jgi:hypothetical protein
MQKKKEKEELIASGNFKYQQKNTAEKTEKASDLSMENGEEQKLPEEKKQIFRVKKNVQGPPREADGVTGKEGEKGR